MANLDNREKTASLDFWQGKPATIATMLLQKEESDALGEAEVVEILDQLPSLNGMELLELGAGIGRYTSHFSQVASRVTAVDFVKEFLDQNRKATAGFCNITYYCTDVMDLEFEPESFDFVFMNWLLMYLNDQEIALLRDRIHQWLRVGGTLFFRESCLWEGSTLGSLKNNPARYRPDIHYTSLFKDHFRLLHQGNIKVYEQRFNRPNQCYWLYCRDRV
jgi:phosphoethanolamine N-methyltransferase